MVVISKEITAGSANTVVACDLALLISKQQDMTRNSFRLRVENCFIGGSVFIVTIQLRLPKLTMTYMRIQVNARQDSKVVDSRD